MSASASDFLLLSYYWPPSGGAGVQRWLKYTRYLSEKGSHPTVVTVDPNQASFPVQDASLLRDVHAGVRVVHTPSFEPLRLYQRVNQQRELPYAGFANEGKVGVLQHISRFIRGNLFIPDPRRGWNPYALAAACRIIEEQGLRTLITTSPPHSTQLIGLELKKRYPHLRWIADLRDPWTGIYYYHKFHHTPLARALDARYERRVLEQADHLLVVSKHILQGFQTKTPVSLSEKCSIIPNGYDPADFSLVGSVPPQAGPLRLAYTGTLAASYRLSGLCKALEEVCRQYGAVHVCITGSADDASVAALRAVPGLQLQLEGHVPHSASIQRLAMADALLLVIPDIPDNLGILTGKLFEYLASQKPILAIGPNGGEALEIVEECASGKGFYYDDAMGMRDYLINLIQRKSAGLLLPNPSNAYQRFSRVAQAEQIAALLVPSTTS